LFMMGSIKCQDCAEPLGPNVPFGETGLAAKDAFAGWFRHVEGLGCLQR
jgi:hypothetical protein